MIEWETAYGIAQAHVAARPLSQPGDQAVLDDRYTVGYDFGWLFAYQSSWYLQTGDDRWRLYDNHPFLVDRRDGRIIEIPRMWRDELLARYQQQWAQGQPLS